MKRIANIFKVLGQETRIKILYSIMKREKCVKEILKGVKKSQPTVSIHLNMMEREKIVESKKTGRERIYKIKNNKIISLLKIAEEISNE
ncbi:MAG: metalloregulator ArsR/SmtB family transcription factor [Candidatus Aenigmatarchaeota archaeon]